MIHSSLRLLCVMLMFQQLGAFPLESRQAKRTVLVYTTANDATDTTAVAVTPKDVVKLFGRLAEKYIVLDSSGGLCCYSACKDCEFRLPNGGYKMADQSAARPKWIPSYVVRLKGDDEVVSKWSTELFANDQDKKINKAQFVESLCSLEYAPPLGGPYVAASAAAVEDTTAAEVLFDLLVQREDDHDESTLLLTKPQMSTRLKELAGGEEGLTWAKFSEALLQ